jgi:NAD(P)-dependent dehydrogenase (short-subunit alcohol dehydrogenase family)
VELSGKLAVITGGASGIGLGTARSLARRGAEIVLADVNDRRLAEAREQVEALGVRVLALHCDVAQDGDVQRLAETVLREAGRVDLLMNNAGVVLRGALEQIEVDDWAWCFGINVLGAVRGLRAFLPHMLQRGSGYVVNTGSVSGLLALTGEGAPYVASKFAVVGLTESLALYCRPRGVGVSLLCPGSVATNLHETGRSIAMTPEREVAETAIAATVQGNRELQPDEVGEAVARAVEQERFFILPDDFHLEMLVRRTGDMSAFLEERLAAAL